MKIPVSLGSKLGQKQVERPPARKRKEVPESRWPGFLLPSVTFVKEAWSELKKAHWPTREQAINLTVVVIAVSVATGLALGLVDFVFSKVLGLLFQQSL
jgi:preprotein translocase subunit SecE